jgi:hypothetical protein
LVAVIENSIKTMLHKYQVYFFLTLTAIAVVVCLVFYRLVRFAKELKQHPIDFESRSTVPGRNATIAELTNEDP